MNKNDLAADLKSLLLTNYYLSERKKFAWNIFHRTLQSQDHQNQLPAPVIEIDSAPE